MKYYFCPSLIRIKLSPFLMTIAPINVRAKIRTRYNYYILMTDINLIQPSLDSTCYMYCYFLIICGIDSPATASAI